MWPICYFFKHKFKYLIKFLNLFMAVQNNTAQSVVPIPATELQKATLLLGNVMDIFKPFEVIMTPEERKKLSKSKNKSFAFVTKGSYYCQKSPQFMPSFYTPEDYKISNDNYNLLLEFQQMTTRLNGVVNDTTMMTAATSYSMGRSYYKSVKEFAAKKVAGAQEIYKDLAELFRKKKKAITPIVSEAVAA